MPPIDSVDIATRGVRVRQIDEWQSKPPVLASELTLTSFFFKAIGALVVESYQ